MAKETLTADQGPEAAVLERYRAAARQPEAALCCPTQYPSDYLKVIPTEVVEKDYGCGDPTAYVGPGETVLDLGSGAGKACFILAQIVGQTGHVIGIDFNSEMLALARRHQATVAEHIGFANVEFRCGMIQDLQLDLELLAAELAQNPVADQIGWQRMRLREAQLREQQPLIVDNSVDTVVSNCVFNLVRREDRATLLSEVLRVLKPGGKAVISDIFADEDVPKALQLDPELWSGCISGAYREDSFLEALETAGFHGIELVKRQAEPWRTVQGIEFRSATVVAWKGKQGPCFEFNQALIYRGPFKQVEDDDGHLFRRGERIAVCEKTYKLLQKPPYVGLFEPVPPRQEVLPENVAAFDCRRKAVRHPRETKGMKYDATTEASSCCDGSSCD